MIEIETLLKTRNNLSPIDLKILNILQKNARRSFQDIATEVGQVTSATIRNRMNRMRRLGIIRFFKACIDPVALGYEIKAFIDIALIAPRHMGKIHQFLRSIPEIHQIYPFSGQYQFRIQVFASSMREFGMIISRISQMEEVREVKTDMIVDLPTFSSEILL